MASASDPGINFKIAGSVDPSFIASVQSAKANVAASNVASQGWQATLKSLGGTLGGAAKFVGALALEQKLHHARTKESTAATVEQAASIGKLTAVMAPLATQIKALVDLQQKQLTMAPQVTQALQQQAQAAQAATSATQSLGGAVSEGTGHLDTFKNAATSAFSGNLVGAVEALGSTVASFALPVAAAVAAISLVNLALNQWEENEKLAGKALEEQSKGVAKTTTLWHKYADAIRKAGGNLADLPKGGKPLGPQDVENARKATNSVSNVAFAAELFKKPKVLSDNQQALNADLSEEDQKKASNVRTLISLKKLRDLAESNGSDHTMVNSNTVGNPEEVNKFLGNKPDDTFASVLKSKLDESIPALEDLVKKSQTLVAVMAKGKHKVDTLTDSLDRMASRKNRIEEVSKALEPLGTLESLVQSRDYAAGQLQGVGHDYRLNNKGAKTDRKSLTDVIVNEKSRPEQREAAKQLIAFDEQLLAADKKIDEFNDAASKKQLAATKAKIAQLGEELALRKALGKSSHADELGTLNKQIGLTKDNDDFRAERTGLFTKKAGVIGQDLEGSLKDQTQGLQQSYKELQSTGEATSAQLAAANAKVAAAATKWKNENTAVLAQYPKLKEQVDALLSSTRQEGGKVKQKSFQEQFEKLKTHIDDGANAAQGLEDRFKATKKAIEETNEAFKKGLISQKQYTQEIGALEKERANQQRAIAESMAQQQKSIDAIKGKISGNELRRLESDKANGHESAGYEQRKEQLQAAGVQSALKLIDDEYQAAIKGNKNQVLAAQEASLKKRELYEQEADKFASEEDRKTAAQKAANKARMGGEASPLVGLGEGAAFSGVEFSGFGNFGDNFGKAHRQKSAFDMYSDAQMPGAVSDVFKKSQSYEGNANKAAQGPAPINVYFSPNVSPTADVKEAVKKVGKLVADQATHKTLSGGHDALSPSADRWQNG